MRSGARQLMTFTFVTAFFTAAMACPIPNRGKQLFLFIEERGGGTHFAILTGPTLWIIQHWNRENPTYDFISAGAEQTDTGVKLNFVRYVMSEDYIPREEHMQLHFPYTDQPRYAVFDSGHITGFYRNSVDDFDPVAEACERWREHPSFDNLRSCFSSVVHRREHRANVEAMLGPGERVTVANKAWDPPTEAYSYTPVDRINFHYVALYQHDIVIGYCSYSLKSAGEALVVVP